MKNINPGPSEDRRFDDSSSPEHSRTILILVAQRVRISMFTQIWAGRFIPPGAQAYVLSTDCQALLQMQRLPGHQLEQ
jgi:hypothetical protein